VKLLPPLGRRAGFRNTTTHGIARNAEQGHSILKRFSEGDHSTPFIHEMKTSKPHKAVLQETWGMSFIFCSLQELSPFRFC
jgi:hypothetical protein